MTTIREEEKLTAYEIFADCVENGRVAVEAEPEELEVLQCAVLRLSRNLEHNIGGELKTQMVEENKMIVSFDRGEVEDEAEESEAARV
jgi:hypothetical protein